MSKQDQRTKTKFWKLPELLGTAFQEVAKQIAFLGLTSCARIINSMYKRLYDNDLFDNKTIAAGDEVINALSEMRNSHGNRN